MPLGKGGIGIQAAPLLGALGTLAALTRARSTGEGCYLDVAESDGATYWNALHLDDVADDRFRERRHLPYRGARFALPEESQISSNKERDVSTMRRLTAAILSLWHSNGSFSRTSPPRSTGLISWIYRRRVASSTTNTGISSCGGRSLISSLLARCLPGCDCLTSRTSRAYPKHRRPGSGRSSLRRPKRLAWIRMPTGYP